MNIRVNSNCMKRSVEQQAGQHSDAADLRMQCSGIGHSVLTVTSTPQKLRL
jgi:hypothetical protein